MADQLCQSSEWSLQGVIHQTLSSVHLGEPNYEQSVYKANCTHSQPALYPLSTWIVPLPNLNYTLHLRISTPSLL